MMNPARCLTGLGWLATVSLVLVAGCAAETEEEMTDSSEAELRGSRYSGHKISKERVASLVRAAGFPERLVWPMTCVAYYESGFDVGAVGYNSASTDRGLFQINSVHVRGDGTDGCPTAAADLDMTRYVSSLRSTPRTSSIFDPATNARCAYGVYESRPGNGMLAWYAYRANRAECDRATARWTPND